jgi:hypothetical protein
VDVVLDLPPHPKVNELKETAATAPEEYFKNSRRVMSLPNFVSSLFIQPLLKFDDYSAYTRQNNKLKALLM